MTTPEPAAAGCVALHTLARLPGWESRLAAVIAAAAKRPYVLGEHDCFRLACSAIDALTGVDRWPEWSGRYGTRRECLALLAEWGSTFTEAGSAWFGAPPVNWRLARRGDVLEFREPDGEAHLVVCNGAHAVGFVANVLSGVPLAACAHAWRVGE